MSTNTVGTDPISVARGRPGSLPMRWQDPAGVAIDVTGFVILAALRWAGVTRPLTITMDDEAAGRWTVAWTDADVIDLPLGTVAFFFVVVTDSAGEPHTFTIPAMGTLT